MVAVSPPAGIARSPKAMPGDTVAAADAVQDEDGFDVGDDGDFVDDAPAPSPAAESVVATTEVQPGPEAAPAAAPPADKPHHRKHGPKQGSKVAAAKTKTPDGTPAGRPDDASSKKDKPRHKHKPKATPATDI